MKIRCKNCYRVLNQNEEYCTSCGEYSERMHTAMVTGNYGPDPIGKFKLAFGIFGIAGFIVCGILQVVFAILETKEKGVYTELYCQTNSLFFSGLAATLFSLIIFRKDLKEFVQKTKKSNIILGLFVGILVIIISILLSKLFKITQILPNFIVNYFTNHTITFFDLKGVCVLKILVGTILATLVLEVLRKYLVDAFDETLLGDKAIYIFTTLIMTVFEIAWFMSLDIAIVCLLINLTTTGIYMYTNRNVVTNMIIRVILYLVTILLLIL